MRLKNEGYTPNIYLVGQILENNSTYSEALDAVRNLNVLSSGYYILTGMNDNEGDVVARSNTDIIFETTLSATDEFFIVETNYDKG